MSSTHATWNREMPSILVFDVNETLIDLESMHPLFARVFGDERVLREWFAQLILYSMTLTLSGLYRDFFALGPSVLEMVGAIHGKSITPADIDEMRARMRTLPAHEDAHDGLKMLKDAGFRMVTLTNSPAANANSPLHNAGLASYFEKQYSVDAARAYKPSAHAYRLVTHDLDVPPSSCCMVACHAWDTLGGQAAGMSSALITRFGNAPLPLAGVPEPTYVAPDLRALAKILVEAKTLNSR